MSITYADLFGDLGALIKEYDAFGTEAEALPARANAVATQFGSDSQLAAIEGIESYYASLRDTYAGRRSQLVNYATARLQDPATVVNQLDLPTNSIDQVLRALIYQMIADSATVNASATTFGSVTLTGVGNGSLLVTDTLDGVSQPGQSFASHPKYARLGSALANPSENMSIACTSDSYQGGTTAGQETFAWNGQIQQQSNSTRPEGSGTLNSFSTTHANTLLSNGEFESFSVANTPDNWTIDAGAVGTEIFSDATAGNFYYGSTGLKLLGTTAAAIQISQVVSLQPARGYVFSARIKADASISAGALTIEFEGTGYTAASTEKISIAAASLPTSWTLKTFLLVPPVVIPSDMKLVIKWTGTPTSTKRLWIDDLSFAPLIYGGGIGAAVIRGNTPFNQGDRFSFAVTNTEGVIQRFFRRAYGVQLPSSGSPTISDSLAT